MMLSYLILSEIQGKITAPLNVGQNDLQKYEVICSVKLYKNPKYDAYLLDRARYIRQKSLDHVI